MNISTTFKVFKLFFVLFIFIHYSDGAQRKIRRGLLHNLHYLEPPETGNDYSLTKDEWFEQRLDHFNAQNTRTWKQRYFSRLQ